MANSDDIKAGQKVFALGSPVGLQNTISDGIISNINQHIGDNNFIQITAPISHGSSGGALVNEYGEVLGITSAGIDDAQNIGFAIPINIVKLFDLTSDGIPYNSFAENNKKFILEVYPNTVEIETGESIEILVYAEGKTNDWSIYWDTNEDAFVACEWGDWYDNTTCPLTITGKRPGNATITIYSDVDFCGKEISVHIKTPPMEFYQNSAISVPTYTAITGVPLYDYKSFSYSDCYTYNFYDTSDVINYIEYLFSIGFTYYDESKNNYDSTQYFYLSPNGRTMSITLAYKWNQIWIFIPK